MTCVMRALSKEWGKADDNGDFRPSYSYRMLNQMQRLKYDRKSHTHILPQYRNLNVWMSVCVYAST